MFCPKSDPKKYECTCMLKGNFSTVRTPIFQVVHILLKPGELKSQIGDPKINTECLKNVTQNGTFQMTQVSH